MCKLPDPNAFKSHRIIFRGNDQASLHVEQPSYDIEAMAAKFKQDKAALDHHFATKPPSDQDPAINPTTLLYQLINRDLIDLEGLRRINPYLGYSERYRSLTVTLHDEDGAVQAVTIRTATDKEGQPVKWKTYGAKTFTPFKINPEDQFIFLHSGMAEILLSELFGFSFIGLQSDSMARHIPLTCKELCASKSIVILCDNDDSFKKIIPTIKAFFDGVADEVITIDFEQIMARSLPKGYDFRDFVNELGNRQTILNYLENAIIEGVCNV